MKAGSQCMELEHTLDVVPHPDHTYLTLSLFPDPSPTPSLDPTVSRIVPILIRLHVTRGLGAKVRYMEGLPPPLLPCMRWTCLHRVLCGPTRPPTPTPPPPPPSCRPRPARDAPPPPGPSPPSAGGPAVWADQECRLPDGIASAIAYDPHHGLVAYTMPSPPPLHP